MKYRIVKRDGRKCSNPSIAATYKEVFVIEEWKKPVNWWPWAKPRWMEIGFALSQQVAESMIKKAIKGPDPIMEDTVVSSWTE